MTLSIFAAFYTILTDSVLAQFLCISELLVLQSFLSWTVLYTIFTNLQMFTVNKLYSYNVCMNHPYFVKITPLEFLRTFSRLKCEGGHRPQTISARGRGHCVQNLHAVSRADQQKILRYWTKYASFWLIIYSLATFFPRLQKTLWGGPQFGAIF